MNYSLHLFVFLISKIKSFQKSSRIFPLLFLITSSTRSACNKIVLKSFRYLSFNPSALSSISLCIKIIQAHLTFFSYFVILSVADFNFNSIDIIVCLLFLSIILHILTTQIF